MNEVEAVARAMCLELGRCGDTEAVERQRVEREWRDYVRKAQAAIAALDAARGDVVARIVEWLRQENGRCDCFAKSETECGCGAWDDWKTKPLPQIADQIEAREWEKKQ